MTTPSGRPLPRSEVLAAIDALPDSALVRTSKTDSWNGCYGAIAIEKRYVSDPDFARGYKDKAAAIADTAAIVRADLRGEGNRYAPHFDPYDVEFRLLPYWRTRVT